MLRRFYSAYFWGKIMNTKNTAKKIAAALALTTLAATQANAAMTITEWMYNPGTTGGEFIEFTNLGTTAVDMTGWSFDDNSRAPGSFSLSQFGIVNPGESVILTEISAAAFRTEWNLGANVKVVGGNGQNLGRSDEINFYDNAAVPNLVDRLTFNDQGTGTIKGPRTQGVSGRASSVAALGANNASLWILSSVADVDGTKLSLTGDKGSPGYTSFATPSEVPVPAAAWLMLSGIGMLGAKMRRKNLAGTRYL